MRTPRSPATADIGSSRLLAWTQPDEPDGIYSQVPYQTIQQQYNTWKSVDPSRKVLINFVGATCSGLGGMFCQYDTRTNESGVTWYRKYAAGADWLSADTYPVNNGGSLTDIRNEVKALKQIDSNKPSFVYIESGDYNTSDSHPGPSADQFRGEVWSAIINGVRGIFYFTARVTPSFQFDVTSPAVATEMTKQHATITQLSQVLQGTINPSSIGATVPSPLEVGWRNAPSGKYFMVLNLSASTLSGQVTSLTGTGLASSATVYGENRNVSISGGKITDNFGPYAVHIYQVQ
jgi:hypothetical protein